ncbi:MAG: hypothetical protein HYU59_04865 [Magnetospirillum gryphiswaldense]|nr:hypothetical protein [Magnetospirillum gryphiswaldense]
MSSCKYHVDVNIVLDATGGMNAFVAGVRGLAGGTYAAVMDGLMKRGKHIDKLRVGVTVFRDIGCDGYNALISSGFFSLPEEEDKLADFLSGIFAMGGGDEPESSLEALASAFLEDWTHEGQKQRHLILLYSDAPPHAYGYVCGPGKPASLPLTFDEVLEIWRGKRQDVKLRSNARQLFLVVPSNIGAYRGLAEEDMVVLEPIDHLMASPEAARSHIIETIVYSV